MHTGLYLEMVSSILIVMYSFTRTQEVHYELAEIHIRVTNQNAPQHVDTSFNVPHTQQLCQFAISIAKPPQR